MEKPNIAIGGRMRAGKTTCAEHLVRDHGYARHALADPIKEIARRDFGWDGMKDAPGRRLLQELGTAARAYDPDVWLRRFDERVAADRGRPVVVDDVRLPREVDHLRGLGFLTLRIVRPAPAGREDPAPELHGHPTETGLDGVPFDLVLLNAGSLEDLRGELERLLAPWLEAPR